MEQDQQFDLYKIKLIVGLGNVEKDYLNTRHNTGFMFVDFLAGNTRFSENKKLKSLIATVSIHNFRVNLAKPITMMNLSGDALSLLQNFYKIHSSEILVVHDDLDIAFGEYKLQFKKGPHEHNGLLSIENRLRTKKFWRLRIGVENRLPEQRQFLRGRDYVLQKFNAEELDAVNQLIKNIIKVHFQHRHFK